MRLDDISVLDLSRLLPGGYTTQLLAEMGANVIKIENPEQGDYSREFEPRNDEGVGAVFAAVNRGKRSVGLDLKTEEGRAALYELATSADVFFESFRPGVAERLEVGYESISAYNEDIIYCSMSGYGQDGSYRDRPGHDVNYASIAGLLDMTRPEANEAPTLFGGPIIDLAAGLFSAFSIVSGLLARTGPESDGTYIDVSMTDVAYSFSMVGTIRAMCGESPRAGETMLTGRYPCYGAYETADGRYVTLAAIEPVFWRRFCERVDRADLIEHHMSSKQEVREALKAELEELFQSRTRREWELEAADSDVPLTVVNTPAETLSDQHLSARSLASTGPDGRAVPHVRLPIQTASGTPSPVDWPQLGEHTDSVLWESGLSRQEIARLREAGVIPGDGD